MNIQSLNLFNPYTSQGVPVQKNHVKFFLGEYSGIGTQIKVVILNLGFIIVMSFLEEYSGIGIQMEVADLESRFHQNG